MKNDFKIQNYHFDDEKKKGKKEKEKTMFWQATAVCGNGHAMVDLSFLPSLIKFTMLKDSFQNKVLFGFLVVAIGTATGTDTPPLTATATATAMYFIMYLYGGRSPPYN